MVSHRVEKIRRFQDYRGRDSNNARDQLWCRGEQCFPHDRGWWFIEYSFPFLPPATYLGVLNEIDYRDVDFVRTNFIRICVCVRARAPVYVPVCISFVRYFTIRRNVIFVDPRLKKRITVACVVSQRGAKLLVRLVSFAYPDAMMMRRVAICVY